MPYAINKLYNFKSNTYYPLTTNKMDFQICNKNIEIYEDGKKFIIIRQKVDNKFVDWMIPMAE